MASRWSGQEGDSTVAGVLVMPVLVLALACVLHLGLFLMARQATLTAVQQGVTVATASDGTPEAGRQVTAGLLADHSAAEIMTVTAIPGATDVTVTATVRAPGLVPGLPRDITVTQTATLERWIGR